MTSPSAPTIVPAGSPAEDQERPWFVIVWDDPVNLMDYVVFVFREVFGFPTEEATRLMLQVHHEGRATVFEGPQDRAERKVQRLTSYGLWATMGQ